LRIVNSAIKILRAVVLVVISVLVSTGGLRLRVIEVLLVEGSNAVGAVLRVLFRIVVHGRHGA
jgi:hypothetical protein